MIDRKNRRSFRAQDLCLIGLGLILQCNFVFAQVSIMCEGASTDTSGNYFTYKSTCGLSFAGNANKYKLQSTYVPTASDPLITVKLVVHVFCPTLSIPQAWNSGSNQYNGLPGLQSLFSQLQNTTDRYSQPRSASYSVSGFTPTFISDSRLNYEVVQYYFYTSEGLYNTDTASNSVGYIEQHYPERFAEGLPIIILNKYNHMSNHTTNYTTTLGEQIGRIPYIVISPHPGGNPTEQAFINDAAQKSIRHELGHCFGLLHTYYGNDPPGGPTCTCYSCSPSPSPENNCNHIDVLDDVFPVSNSNCAQYSSPNSYTVPGGNCALPPLNSCQSCYETNVEICTNNIMSDNSFTADNGWISPLQMGRRIRSMHLMYNGSIWPHTAPWGNIRYYAKEMFSGSNINSVWYVTSDETWDFDIQMYEDILIAPYTTLTIKCNVGMAARGKIVVSKGAKLIIDGGEIYGWCKKAPAGSATNSPMWWGIEVVGDPSLPQYLNPSNGYYTNHGYVEIKNGAKIRGAEIGVRTSLTALGTWLANTSGGIVKAENSIFENNVFDIVMYKFQGWEQSTITSCTFITNGELGRSYDNSLIIPKAHIKLFQNWRIHIRGCVFEYSVSAGYTATGHKGIGLHATDSHFYVNQYCASNPCGTPVNTVFKNLYHGVYIDNFNPLFMGDIRNCDFLYNEYGLTVRNAFYLKFMDNNIVLPPVTGAYRWGVYLNSARYYAVKSNTITSTTQIGTGIAAYNSQDGLHQIYRNTIEGVKTGINAIDDNGGYNHNVNGLRINCNVFNSGAKNTQDVAMTVSFSTKPSIMRRQGDKVISGPQNLVRNLYDAYHYPNNQYLKTKWYIHPSYTVSMEHPSTISGADNPTVPNAQSSSQVWVQTFSFPFTWADDCPAEPPSSGGSSIGVSDKLDDMNEYLTDLVLDNSEGEHDAEIQATVASKMNLFLSEDIEGANDSIAATLSENISNMADADIQQIFADFRTGAFTSAADRIENLGGGREDWKDLLEKMIVLEQDSLGVMSLLGTHSDYVGFLEDCAETNGKDGQGIAQAILTEVFGNSYEFPLPEPPEPDPEEEGQKTAQDITGEELILKNNPRIKVYPNPLTAGFIIENAVTESEMLKAEVKDLLGRHIYTNFVKKDQKLYVPFKDFNNGIYLLSLKNDTDQIIFQSKLVKQE